MNPGTDLPLLARINSEWLTDLRVQRKTIKLLEGNVGENLNDLG